uniref:probable G-protein coupled receptor 160 n=1 Tax=Gasterosteus aculeatus aculeatus TaxID=481459 RepID=UPI001A99A6F0|nr:probable G-protein coupled receptor 160 [Gasterosteus aculeatus aculeatus]
MLAVIEGNLLGSVYNTTNTNKYLFIMLLKLVLDTAVLCLCSRRLHTSFISMCGLSIVLGDSVMVIWVSSLYFLPPETCLVALCFLLTNASVIFDALTLPIVCLCLLDCYLEGTNFAKQSTVSKFLRHTALTLLVWVIAVLSSFGSVKSGTLELKFEDGLSATGCEVRESTLANFFILGSFSIITFTTLPFWSMIPRWVRESVREFASQNAKNQNSDSQFSTKGPDTRGFEETVYPRPPLWLSTILCLSLTWMPYITITVVFLLLGVGLPAYATVNLQWLECTNSLVMGVMFWANSVHTRAVQPHAHSATHDGESDQRSTGSDLSTAEMKTVI